MTPPAKFAAVPIVRPALASGDSILSHGGPPLRSASRQARFARSFLASSIGGAIDFLSGQPIG
jgi:hypothetical protein